MSKLSPSLRKAAVLISALDEPTADAILRQMSADDAAKVRSALVELSDIPSDEQQEVLAEFLNRQGSGSLTVAAEDDVSLEIDPEVEAAVAVDMVATPASLSPISAMEPLSFAFLADVDSQALAAVLSRELPQTVAVVIAHLPPERAAAVLELLPAALATDSLERIAWLDQISPEVQADLIRELRRQLAPHIKTAKAATASLAHVTAVLGAMDFRQRQRVVLQLGERNASLLNRLGLSGAALASAAEPENVVAMRYRLDSPSTKAASRTQTNKKPNRPAVESAWLTFDDLVQLDDTALRAVFAAAETEIALLALTGADPRLTARILRKLPPRDAAVLRHRLEHPGPLRLRDVEQARTALAAIASRLAHEGTINLPASIRFAAAV